MNSKKGSGGGIGSYVIYFIIVMIFVLFMSLSLRAYQGLQLTDTIEDQRHIESLLVAHTVVESCLVSKPYVIDVTKLTDEQLKTCFPQRELRVTLLLEKEYMVKTFTDDLFFALHTYELPVLVENRVAYLRVEVA